MTLSLTQAAVNLIHQSGYAGLALGLVVDSAGIPIPSEVLIPLATVSAQQGKFSLIGVAIVGTLAQTVGGVVAYEIGRRGGLPLIHRYGKYVFLSNRELNYTHRQFARYGRALAFVGRCIPVIRGYVGFVAGIAEMPRMAFLLATLAGSFAWTAILMGAGLLLAHDIGVIDRILAPVSGIILAVIVIAILIFVYRHWRNRRQA